MATIKQLSSGVFQIRVTSKLLPKPFYASFETREQALAYSNHLRELLAQGIVPQALLKVQETVRQEWMISRCIAEYLRSESVPISEVKLLGNVRSNIGNLKTSDLSYDWADAWTRQLKRQDNLAPSTIRHRDGALARCLDWMCRKHPEILGTNPLRLLKRGFATYTAEDKKYVLAKGGTPKIDVERNRRLDEEEEKRILAILKDLPEEKTFFVLALESAMRMRECYTLDLDQVSLQKRTVHLVRTKNGDSREVPLSSTTVSLLKTYITQQRSFISQRGGRLFSFWNGDRSVYALDAATALISITYGQIFKAAQVGDFHFHDLRHEATCRLYQKTSLSDVLIARITGHHLSRIAIVQLNGRDSICCMLSLDYRTLTTLPLKAFRLTPISVCASI